MVNQNAGKRQGIEVKKVDKLVIRPTRITPLVYFDPDRALLELRGKSSPENSIQFYKRLLIALERYAHYGTKDITANFKLEYFNTSSSKCLFDAFKRLMKAQQRGISLTINWYYEEYDTDMLESGEDYSDLLGFKFNYIETVFN
ncbi:DUF1987 domain-containing protein [Reichenbachiella sp. MALMAid0571]|uniref:DUF1987 domain-containing protein n=1 Tax=Reichenbachiella sp. MALMAid0571 TaxID=3143939 RepID=UPI0032DF9698